MKWNKNMYEYLAWLTLKEVFGTAKWVRDEGEKIDSFLNGAKNNLNREEALIVENRASRMRDEYLENVEMDVEDRHWDDFDDDSHDRFGPPDVSYKREYYDLWSQGARKKRTVWIRYDSVSSGMTDREVDPYKTNSPYGFAYCHKRKEIRQFRFDRIIDIKLTAKKFEKPKDWEKRYKKNQIESAHDYYSENDSELS